MISATRSMKTVRESKTVIPGTQKGGGESSRGGLQPPTRPCSLDLDLGFSGPTYFQGNPSGLSLVPDQNLRNEKTKSGVMGGMQNKEEQTQEAWLPNLPAACLALDIHKRRT